MLISRRTTLLGLGAALASRALAACSDSDSGAGTSVSSGAPVEASTATPEVAAWRMPSEEDPHERTWMCWPSNREVWGGDLADVQAAIERIVWAIAEFEPVTLLARDAELVGLADRFGRDIELVAGPVDDLWARDTLPNFVLSTAGSGQLRLGAAHARFNGWGGKQVHSGDTQLAALVATHLGVELFDSGLVGEGGGIEVDGLGTVLAAESCWVNDNRNPGRSRDDIEAAILRMLGAERMIWVPGLAGFDITDGHIDTLARFVGSATILVDRPAIDDPDDPWVEVAAETFEFVSAATHTSGAPYDIEVITQPLDMRGGGDDFLSTYMNFYVCNGAVIAPEFGDDAADAAAFDRLAELFPDREIVMVDIDPLAAGGGGIHCATQQQPAIA